LKIKNIVLSGYRSIEPTTPLVLDEFGHINLFIGANNCGKSSLFRFIQTSCGLIQGNKFELFSNLQRNTVDESWWWDQSPRHNIDGLLTIEGQPECELNTKLPGRFDDGKQWKLRIRLIPTAKGGCGLVIAPQVWLHSEWHDLVQFDGKRPMHLNADGSRVSSLATDSCPYHEAALEVVKNWAARARFFDPVRALDRGGGRRSMIDGSELLRTLSEAQQDPRRAREFEVFRSELVAELNGLIFDPVGMRPIRSMEIKGTFDKNDLDMFLTHEAGGPVVSLQHMGTGIGELVILFATLLRDKSDGCIYFMEEPETHLHAALVRRLLRKLQATSNSQFFLSTHSNILMDGLRSDDRIFHFMRKSPGGTQARRCDVLTEFHDVLDDLGVAGSALLQANCILWVEGPSDRIYLAKWLTSSAQDLVEGSDYAFAFYGGRVLSHFAFSDQDGLISLIKVNRFSAVIMDRDIGPNEDLAAVRDTKARLASEASTDPTHRLAIFSEGREIENDVGRGVLGRALGSVIAEHAHSWQNFEPDGTGPYTQQAASHALPNGNAEDIKRLSRRIQQNKVDIARRAVSDPQLATPLYVSTLIDFVRRSRTD